jgi:zinc finger protein GLIS1/3
VKEETDVNSPDTGNYICLWLDCNEEFDNPKTYVDHVNEAHMETRKGCEEFPCLWKDCPRAFKAFNAKYKLITHMRVHTKEKPYRCTYENCTRAFARSENRKIHVRSHTGQKPFSCKYALEFNCSKKFSNSSDRAKHEQTHKDPKPYKCEVVGCTKRYTDPSSLRKHVKGHSQESSAQVQEVVSQIMNHFSHLIPVQKPQIAL